MNNASKNLEEVLDWIVKGIDVQFFSDKTDTWEILTVKQFALMDSGLALMWRKKPDAFEEALNKQLQALTGSSCYERSVASHYFQKGWQEALKNKGAKCTK